MATGIPERTGEIVRIDAGRRTVAPRRMAGEARGEILMFTGVRIERAAASVGEAVARAAAARAGETA